MKCPKCSAAMESLRTSHGVIQRCTGCQGLWLDMLVNGDLGQMAAEVDSGDPVKGGELNKVDRIYCPVCPNSKMLRMVDPLQPHIWFESCANCYGRFFDAGELTDLSERTLEEFFRKFKARARN